MREIIFLLPPIVAIVNGMAWLALRKDSQSARPWAIAASISFLVLSAPFLVADLVILHYQLAGAIEFGGVLLLFLTLNSLGIVGVVAFGKRDAMIVPAQSRPAASNDTKSFGTLASAA